MSRRPRIGDIIEIPLPTGNAYAQFTHKHPQYGALIRVLKSIYPEIPAKLGELLIDEPLFITFFPLGAAINRNVVKVVSNVDVPDHSKQFPIFKAGVPNAQGKVETWWLWDGENETRVDSLSEEQKDYPVRGVINDTLLVERISSQWRHRDAVSE